MLKETYERKKSKLLALALSTLIVVSGFGCARSAVAQRQVSIDTTDSSSETAVAHQYEAEKTAEDSFFVDSVLTNGSVVKYYGVRSYRSEQTLVSHLTTEKQTVLHKEIQAKGTELDIVDNGSTELSLTEDTVTFKSKKSLSRFNVLIGLLVVIVVLLFFASRVFKILQLKR